MRTAIYDLLVADATFVAFNSTYQGQPAIFGRDPVPGDADLPYTVISGPIASPPFDTKTENGDETTYDVRCYQKPTGDPDSVERMSERARELLHDAILTRTGFTCVKTSVDNEVNADEEEAYGRILVVRSIFQKENP